MKNVVLSLLLIGGIFLTANACSTKSGTELPETPAPPESDSTPDGSETPTSGNGHCLVA